MCRRLLAVAVAGVMTLSAASVQARDRIVIAAQRVPSSAAVFIAKAKGYFAEEGLEATFSFFGDNLSVAEAVASEKAAFGVSGLSAGLYTLAGKGALRIIGAESREAPPYAFSAYVVSNQAWAAGFRRVDQFPGHSFAMTKAGSPSHYMISLLAKKNGFALKKISLKPLQTLPAMIDALFSGQADSMILPAPVARPLQQGGHAHIIGWVYKETPWQSGVLLASARKVQKRRPLVEKFVRAYLRAARDYNAAMNRLNAKGSRRIFGPKAEALIPIINRYVYPKNLSAEKVKAGAPFIDARGRLNVGDIYKQVAWYQKQRLVDKGVDARKFIDLSFIDGHFNVPAN